MTDVINDKFYGMSSQNSNVINVRDDLHVPCVTFILSLLLLYALSPPFLYFQPSAISLPKISLVRVFITCLSSTLCSMLLHKIFI